MQLSSFWRNVSTVAGGTVAAQIIPMATLPLLARWIPAAQLGEYFVWLGAATVISVVATARLDIALFMARSDAEVFSLVRSIFLISTGVASLTIAAVHCSVYSAPELVLSDTIREHVVALSLMAWALAADQTLQAVFIYRAQFGPLALAKIARVTSVSVAQLLTATLITSAVGLLYAQVATSLLSVLVLLRFLGLSKAFLAAWDPHELLQIIRANYRFPMFALPSDILGSIAGQLPIFIIAARFDASSAAAFALTLRAIAAPAALLASSVLTVFKERAGREYRERGDCLPAYRHAFRSLVVLAIAPSAFIHFWGAESFNVIFGPEWMEAGRFAELLAPMIFMRLIASPLSYTLYIANRQTSDLAWQGALLVTTWACFSLGPNLEVAVASYSLAYGSLYMAYLLLSYRAARGQCE